MGRVMKRIETLVGLKGIILSDLIAFGMKIWRVVVWLRFTDVSEQLLPVLPLLTLRCSSTGTSVLLAKCLHLICIFLYNTYCAFS